MTKREAEQYREHINILIKTLDDTDALQVTDLFEPWKTNTYYTVNYRVKYQDKLYRCVQSHTSQENWTPDLTPALWAIVSVEEWPKWIQPTGAQDAYKTGDKVSHNELHWISNVDYNTWEPGVYGWDNA